MVISLTLQKLASTGVFAPESQLLDIYHHTAECLSCYPVLHGLRWLECNRHFIKDWERTVNKKLNELNKLRVKVWKLYGFSLLSLRTAISGIVPGSPLSPCVGCHLRRGPLELTAEELSPWLRHGNPFPSCPRPGFWVLHLPQRLRPRLLSLSVKPLVPYVLPHRLPTGTLAIPTLVMAPVGWDRGKSGQFCKCCMCLLVAWDQTRELLGLYCPLMSSGNMLTITRRQL